ncbi:MAG: holo-ACP synthase [Campylobacter sp.]|nr:holo-ACP synthase [Campylobacter sp.]
MIGIDIVEISRIEKLKVKFGDKFTDRILNQSEIMLVKNDVTLAGFYAAKEAISKALGTGIGSEFGFKDCEIYKDLRGSPCIKFTPEISNKFKIQKADLSISHAGGFAIAAVIILKQI